MSTDTAWTKWPAPAKLNLFLHVLGRRPDGYHELQTVFRLLDWCDLIAIRLRTDGRIVRLRGAAGVAAENDLAVRAAHVLVAHVGHALPGADLAIHKQLPMGAGLGGGSSDAATVLVALNRLWDLGLNSDTLAQLGLQLGADVPVFVHGHSAWAEGVGEELTPLRLGPAWYVVLDPHCEVSTAALFAEPELTRDMPPATISGFSNGAVAKNAFEPLVRARHRQVAAALDWLSEYAPARLTGTGAAVFAEFAEQRDAQRVARACPPAFTAVVAKGIDRSPLLDCCNQAKWGVAKR